MATGHKGVAPALYALMDLKVMLCMDSHLEPLLVLMIETPHPVHTLSRSSLYIYKVFEHLQQWLREFLCLSSNNNHEITECV